jgi:hypothetical protein
VIQQYQVEMLAEHPQHADVQPLRLSYGRASMGLRFSTKDTWFPKYESRISPNNHKANSRLERYETLIKSQGRNSATLKRKHKGAIRGA